LPAPWLTTHAADALKTLTGHITSDATLLAALEQDAALLLGQSSDTHGGIGHVLTVRIAAILNTAAGLISSQVDAGATSIVDSLTAVFPALGATAIRETLKTGLADLVSRVQQGAGSLAQALLEQAGGLGAIEVALAKVGVAAGSTGSDLDKALAGVRAFIARYDGLLHKVVDFTSDTAKARISARLVYEHKQSLARYPDASPRSPGRPEPCIKPLSLVGWRPCKRRLSRLFPASNWTARPPRSPTSARRMKASDMRSSCLACNSRAHRCFPATRRSW
jgi:hypothetical protein